MAKNKTISKRAKKTSAKEPKTAYKKIKTITPVASGAHKKAERISLRVSEVHKKAIIEASELAGFKNVNDYIIHITLVNSQKVVREHKLLTLSGRDSMAFLDALHRSQKVDETLQKAMDEFIAEQGR